VPVIIWINADAIDAAVVCLAGDGDDILTPDPGDLLVLAQAAGVHVELIPVQRVTLGLPESGPSA
jgi:hypothetical protein